MAVPAILAAIGAALGTSFTAFRTTRKGVRATKRVARSGSRKTRAVLRRTRRATTRATRRRSRRRDGRQRRESSDPRYDQEPRRLNLRKRRGCLGVTLILGLPLTAILIAAPMMAASFSESTNAENPLGFLDEDDLGESDPDVDLTDLAARTGIPIEALQAYWSAAVTWGVDWAILAAIGKHECDHGRYQAAGCNPRGTINGSGARGPMQFLGSTWRSSAGQYDLDVAGPPIPRQEENLGYATDGNGNGNADPWEWEDATHAAARYLLENGIESDVRNAIYAYNHLWSYVDDVMATAAQYRAAAGAGAPGSGAYRLPLDAHWYNENKYWFQKTHHDYPASDIPVPTGTPVYAAAAGTVFTASGKCGTGIVIQGDDGMRYIYCHGSERKVSSGHVEAGQLIMVSGNTGNSTGPHLHFAIKLGDTSYCPQFLFYAVMKGNTVTPRQFPTSGCSHTNNRSRIADGLPTD